MNPLNLLPYYFKYVCYSVTLIAAGIWVGSHLAGIPLNETIVIACKVGIVLGLNVAMGCKEKFEEERNDILRLRAAFGSLSLLGVFLIIGTISPNSGSENGLGFFELGILILLMYHLGFQISKRVGI